jgi:uncharacterized Zn finger protein
MSGTNIMPKRKSNKTVPARQRQEPTAELRKALSRRSKTELVDVLVELAEADRGVLRQLKAQFDVAAASDELVAATRQAIVDATDFDDREIGHNFDYDYAAYEEVKRNLARLIDSGELRPSMELALELMKQGSYQVEMSDEGMMSDDIEECLGVVLKSLKKCDLPADELIAWCSAMLDADRVEGIAREQLESLRIAPRRLQFDSR